MDFFKKLFKNKKGSGLVEKIMVTAFAVAAGGAVIVYTSNVIINAQNNGAPGINLVDGGAIQTSPGGHPWASGAYGPLFNSENSFGGGWSGVYIDSNGIMYKFDDESAVLDVYKNAYAWENSFHWSFNEECTYLDTNGFYDGDEYDGKLHKHGSTLIMPSGVSYSTPVELLNSFKSYYPSYSPMDLGSFLSYGLYADDGGWLYGD